MIVDQSAVVGLGGVFWGSILNGKGCIFHGRSVFSNKGGYFPKGGVSFKGVFSVGYFMGRVVSVK